MTSPRRGRPQGNDHGFTITEMMVAISIFMMLMVAVMTTVISVSRAVDNGREFTNINEQARIAFERITRELRQASEIQAVEIPPASGGSVEMTFGVDFNGNRTIDNVAADPEVLTYRYDHTQERLTLTANDLHGNAITRPILASEVTAFTLEYRSSLWQYDSNGDGITDWTEIDGTVGVGNQNGVLDVEIDKIDSVAITLTVMEDEHRQTYQTQVGLRNRSQS